MELKELCLEDKLLVYLDLPKPSELICRKIRIISDNDNFSHSHFKVCIDELLFIKEDIEIDNLTLSNVKGIISPFNKRLLVTISFDNNFYEVICNAVFSEKFHNSFQFLDIQTESELLPNCYSHVILNKIESLNNYYIRSSYQRLAEAIKLNETDKENANKEFSDFIIKKIASIASSGVYRKSGPGYNSNSQDSKECYYGCHIHSIEILRDFELNVNSINNYLMSDFMYKIRYGQQTIHKNTAYNKWIGNDLKITYSFEEKTIELNTEFEEQSSRFTWGEGYQEYGNLFRITMKKQFATRFQMLSYIQYFENLLVSEGAKFNNERNVITDYRPTLKIFQSDFDYNEVCHSWG